MEKGQSVQGETVEVKVDVWVRRSLVLFGSFIVVQSWDDLYFTGVLNSRLTSWYDPFKTFSVPD